MSLGGPARCWKPWPEGPDGRDGTFMLRDDLDRIRIEVQAKEDLLSNKRKELIHTARHLRLLDEASGRHREKTSLKKSHQRISNDIRTLEEGIKCLREEHARKRNRLERVIAIKGVGSLPPELPEKKASTSSGSTTSSSPPSPGEPMPTRSSAPDVAAQAVSPPSTNDLASAAKPPTIQSSEEARREVITRKVENPQIYPTISICDAATYFAVTSRTIHRWKDDGNLKSGARRGTITTKSMQQWMKKRSRKRPPQ